MIERCVALNDQGKRCRKQSVRLEQLHLDGELYGHSSHWNNSGGPTWVSAPLCEAHSPDIYRKSRSETKRERPHAE